MSSKYKFVYIFIILVVFSFVFYGCAGGELTNGAGSGAMTSSGPAPGNIKLVINWPQKVKNFTLLESHSINGGVLPAQFLTGFIKTIPATATQIAIDIYKADNETSTLIPTTTVHRSTGTSSVTTTIVGIPIGNIKIKAAALNSSGTTLATGNTTTMLQQGDNSGVTLNLVDRYTTYAWLSTSNEKSYEQGKALTPWSTSKGIHMGVGISNALSAIPTVTAPGMSTASMNTQGVTPMEKIRGVYYVGYNTKTGNPELTVQGNFDINFQNSSYYSYDLNNVAFISGAYVFNINNVNYTISNPMSDYCSLPEITSPEINTAINVKNKINVQWLNLGSDYVYLIFAAHYKLDNTNEADIFWASNDWRDLTTSDMDTFTNLINELTSSNSCTVPANLFTAGTNIKIMVIAVNKEHYNVDTSESVGKTFLGIGQYSVTYDSK